MNTAAAGALCAAVLECALVHSAALLGGGLKEAGADCYVHMIDENRCCGISRPSLFPRNTDPLGPRQWQSYSLQELVCSGNASYGRAPGLAMHYVVEPLFWQCIIWQGPPSGNASHGRAPGAQLLVP